MSTISGDILIYFLLDRSVNRVKIGTTRSPESFVARMRSHRCGNSGDLEVVRLETGGHEKERRLHREFANLRYEGASRGEWFRNEGTLYNFLKKNAGARL